MGERLPGDEARCVDKLKALFACRFGQTTVQSVEAMAPRFVLCPAERGSELQGIRRAERVPQQSAFGIFTHLFPSEQRT